MSYKDYDVLETLKKIEFRWLGYPKMEGKEWFDIPQILWDAMDELEENRKQINKMRFALKYVRDCVQTHLKNQKKPSPSAMAIWERTLSLPLKKSANT